MIDFIKQMKERNERSKNNPTPGDYWHERFIPALIVLHVTDNDVYLCKTVKKFETHSEFDLTDIKKMTRDEFSEYVSYKGIEGTWCDVSEFNLMSDVEEAHPHLKKFIEDESKPKEEIDPKSALRKQILQIATDAVKEGKLIWTGFDKDENEEYTIPVLSESNYRLVELVLERMKAN